ncbi:ATP-citrate synthase-like [Hydractinia symbiolongicarpus]|uniref:ATP-citrate synthase-like n=1 Tax=Hydractinia symbiolongicarpus TaxID=13093 RepID=UPI00254AFDA3|nr:ATP-citrate synthase-like [Hydractinia symbiolongicarpus]
MSSKAIFEGDGKRLLKLHLKDDSFKSPSFINISEHDNLDEISVDWPKEEKLVVKPDQLIKRRGKLGLLKVNTDWTGVKDWLNLKRGHEIQVEKTTGKLKNFIVEPFVKHEQNEEMYVCIYTQRDEDVILFHHQGGMDIGDVDGKALRLTIPIGKELEISRIQSELLKNVCDSSKTRIGSFIKNLFVVYVDLHFTYLEINPLVVKEDGIYVLDLAAKIDQTAEYLCSRQWGKITFPPPFGREAYPEEAFIADLDAKSGASLKLTVLNKKGKIWTMVAGGGASVVYSDTIAELGGSTEMANYGEYSGAPSETQTFEYAKTILKLMTEGEPFPDGKILIIGGGIANFTNVSATFAGIVKALQMYQQELIKHQVKIFVRRGGPNYQEGLRIMRDLGETLGVPMHVFGTETHMTAIVGMALGKREIPEKASVCDSNDAASKMFFNSHDESTSGSGTPKRRHSSELTSSQESARKIATHDSDYVMVDSQSHLPTELFSKRTKAIVWGMQQRAIQGMLDFDYVCSRKETSVKAIVYPFSGNHNQKFYFGHKEIMIPVYSKMEDAVKKFPDVDVLVNFASLRSAYDATIDAIQHKQFRTVAIIAEGIPERVTQKLNKKAKELGVNIIGPATVGGIKPGCFKIGNTGGMLDNILASKLYRPGSVGYISRSGGLSNELNNIIARNTDGVNEGIAIGGDRYPGTVFIDHFMRYQANPDIKMMVLLGEVGGVDEYEICQAIKKGQITKPVVAWCIGTCAGMLSTEVQFGHANACANSEMETAVAKNKALQEAGAHVPRSFDDLGITIKQIFDNLVADGTIVPKPEVRPPTVPMDYSWAQELGLIRKPSSFISAICDERGQELLYAGMKISDVFKEEMGIGGVLGLLWFQRRLPSYACKFIEMCLMITADHGPAVSGAHNTIVTSRAGKDLISSLCSGLLTIGDRFGGALDGAANQFSEAYDSGKSPMEFVNDMRKMGKLIMGIGHRVKSINNPDMRVVIMKDFIKESFPQTPLLDYALQVEKVTTAKKPNLILNVDGCIAVAFVDMLRHCGCFTRTEADEYIKIGAMNGLFVLGRSVGFIGHHLDQKRLKQGLYRHPWDDISYVIPETANPPAPFE